MPTPRALLQSALMLLLFTPVATSAAWSARAAPEPDVERLVQQPLGFAVLDLEAAAGVDVRPAAAALARVLAAARAEQPFESPRAALEAIARASTIACPRLVDDAGDGLISGALREGACDCDILVVLYLTVADLLGLPMTAVFMPDHVLVRWDDGSTPIYWETTIPEERPEWFLEALVPEGAERAYLQPQSRREMVGYALQVRANYRIGRGDTDASLDDYDLAVRLAPSLVVTRLNRARALVLDGQPARALTDYEHGLHLDPSHVDAVYGRALALLALGRPADALRALDPLASVPEADVVHAQGLAYAGLGQDTRALDRFDAALALDPSFALAYLARGELHERRGDVDRARQDYADFVRLALGTAHAVSIPDVHRRLLRLGASG